MTTTTVRLLSEFAPTTTESAYLTTRGVVESASDASVTFFKCVYDLAEPAARDGFVDADDVLAEYERIPELNDALVAARHAVATLVEEKCASPLAVLRLKAGLSQRRLAEMMGTQQSYIARIEGSGGDLVLSTMERLARALHADLRDVVSAIQFLRQK